ncbi:DUF4253 domain-containing protein [Streptomyces physcomitrii]|uniref:DUF4253 domain-containing protein n=1 Tax=Streptomyces physcomitrii TaxID=2724184 RepID=A0ABX1H7S4_9ACTN|nr:DUF4253 domain-containing protein [Streptomyces physcomitrii]NKI44421.1 DUF4253 domain-containing protein [Streptomyces physcomitrii]
MAMLPNPLPKLADDPTGRGLGLELPPGGLVSDTADGPWPEPLLWCSTAPARAGDWSALLPARRTAGLHPVLLGADRPEVDPAAWELMPELASYPGDHDAEDVLAGFWEEYAEDELSEAHGQSSSDNRTPGVLSRVKSLFTPSFSDAPPAAAGTSDSIGSEGSGTSAADSGPDSSGPDSEDQDPASGFDWPGLAPAGREEEDPEVRAAAIADLVAGGNQLLPHSRLGLVPARRSADIPAAIGWSGPVNHENDVARLCAVLRSWEDRFGIRVVALGFDIMVVSVAAPPATLAEAEQLAAEHFAFCPDNLQQGDHTDLRAYAKKELLGQHFWTFWWD